MKSLSLLLFLLIAGFLVYDYQFAPRDKRMIFKKEVPKSPAVRKRTDTAADSKPVQPLPKAPAMAAATSSSNEAAAPPRFVPPRIPTLEEVTKNWHQIPERAFPRQVILRTPVEMKIAVGSTLVAAGTQVLAIAAAQGELLVTPSAESSARGRVRVIDTDFPDQIQSTYGAWKNHRIELARQKWEARQREAIASSSEPKPNPKQNPGAVDAPAGSLDASGKPIRNSRGNYDILLASIRRGEVTEVVPDEVKRWGEPRLTRVQGEPTWIIDVEYEYMSLFGLMPVTAHAHVQDGKVVRWLYPSGEPVE